MFQFHSGSINIDKSNTNKEPVSEFQFHSGSINIVGLKAIQEFKNTFQFHSGSINIMDTMRNLSSDS